MIDWEQRDYILIIEDDEDVSESLTEMLQKDGHRVVTFGDGRQALDYLRQKSVLPKLILLDFLMPHMDGWQFLAEYRKDRRIAGSPVVGISASDQVHEDLASHNLADLLKKPVSLDALLDAVERYAPARRTLAS
jgi:two-component system, chemotaxis family, chemotaxis protein CheY